MEASADMLIYGRTCSRNPGHQSCDEVLSGQKVWLVRSNIGYLIEKLLTDCLCIIITLDFKYRIPNTANLGQRM